MLGTPALGSSHQMDVASAPEPAQRGTAVLQSTSLALPSPLSGENTAESQGTLQPSLGSVEEQQCSWGWECRFPINWPLLASACSLHLEWWSWVVQGDWNRNQILP